MKRRGRGSSGRPRGAIPTKLLLEQWPHAVNLDCAPWGYGEARSDRLFAWLKGRDWRRGPWPSHGASQYRFKLEADADAFAAEFGGRRSS